MPSSVTILDALVLAGHEYLRGCGCRVGVCGECAVVFRVPGSNQVVSERACQTTVVPDMRIVRVPFQWNRAYQNACRSRTAHRLA